MVNKFLSKRGNLIARYLTILFSLLMSSPGMASVQASLDRENVYQGESFTLTITSDASQGKMPDLSLLEKDFHILGTGSSRQYQIVNGAATARTSWNIQLQAKDTGQFLIPSLRVGKELTNPIQVVVAEPPEASSSESGQNIFIEVEVDSADEPIYLQQQVLYVVRLVFDQPILDGSLSDPAPEHALVEQLGKNERYSRQRNGETFTVIERRYAIFPEKSGQLVIPPLRFSGSLVSRSYNRSRGNIDPMMKRFFGSDPFAQMQGQGRPVTVQSKQVTLDVLPRPSTNSSKHWLPAAALVLKDSWVEQAPEFKVGEPVTRILTIEAKGLLATFLPEMEIKDVDGVSIYPEQPEIETRTDGTWVFGQSSQSLSYIPTKAGPLLIPELELSWWDTETGTERTAVLPKWTVEVLPGIALPEQAAVQAEDRLPDDKVTDTTASQDEPIDTLYGTPWVKQIQQYWKILSALLLLLILLAIWVRRNRSDNNYGIAEEAKNIEEASAVHKQTQRELRQQLQKACRDNDASSTADIILKIAAITISEKPPKTLPSLAAILQVGSTEIVSLDRHLYAVGDKEWNGENFYEFFKDGLVLKATKKEAHESLAPLYPS